MANRLLADHIELAGIEEAGIAAGSELETVQDLWIDEIADAIHRRMPRAAGIATMAVFGDLDRVKVDIHARRPGLVNGHGHAEFDRLRAELEELTGKSVIAYVSFRSTVRGLPKDHAVAALYVCATPITERVSTPLCRTQLPNIRIPASSINVFSECCGTAEISPAAGSSLSGAPASRTPDEKGQSINGGSWSDLRKRAASR